jgi:hypothetical protein
MLQLGFLMNLVYACCFVAAAPAFLGQNLAGVGVSLMKEGDHIVVTAIAPDSPAALSKQIHIGDRITAVAQLKDAPVNLQGMTLTEAIGLIRGVKGTAVRLTIVPAGKDETQARVVSLMRGEIKDSAGGGVFVPFDVNKLPPQIFQPATPPPIVNEVLNPRHSSIDWHFWIVVLIVVPLAASAALRNHFRPVSARSAKPAFLVVGAIIICAGIGLAFFVVQTEGPVSLFFGGIGLLLAGSGFLLSGLPLVPRQ